MRMLSRLLAPAAVLGTVVLLAAPAQAAPSNQDASWVQTAHQSNLVEIAAGNAAQQAATTPEVKQLGAMFVQMHTELDTALTQAAQQLGVQLPGAPTAEQQAQLAAVQKNTGPSPPSLAPRSSARSRLPAVRAAHSRHRGPPAEDHLSARPRAARTESPPFRSGDAS
jgi:hypothetical protein